MSTSDFVFHLEELRKRLLISIIAFVSATILCFIFSKELIDFLIEPLQKSQNAELFFHKPYDAFLTHLKVSGLVGLILSSPVLFSQAWLFLTPGLYPNERKLIFPLIFVSVLLFLIGASFAFFVVIPIGLHFLLSFQTEGLRPLLGIGPYFSFVVGMVISFGVLFDFPVVILGLVKLGVVKSSALARLRKVIIVGIFILAAILTPSPDPVSQLCLALPLILLFEVSLWIAKFMEKTKK